MAFHAFSEYGIHEVIISLIQEAFTGSVAVNPDQRCLFFEQGNLVYANSQVGEENYAAILVEMGVITQEKVDALRAELTTGQSLGKRLRQDGLADPKQLAQALKQQIMRVVHRVVNMEQGEYALQPGDLPGKLPKLKIRSAPLFVKSFLIVEDEEFPKGLDESTVLIPGPKFQEAADLLNIPAPYLSALELVDGKRSLQVMERESELDLRQIRRLAYISTLLQITSKQETARALEQPFEEATLDSLQVSLAGDASLNDLLVNDAKEKAPEPSPNPEFDEPDAVALQARDEEAYSRMPDAESPTTDPSYAWADDQAWRRDDEGDRESQLASTEFEFDGSKAPDDESFQLEGSLALEVAEEAPGSEASSVNGESMAEDSMAMQEDLVDDERGEMSEDPVDALNRALTESEDLAESKPEPTFSPPITDSDETMPNVPLSDLMEGLQAEQEKAEAERRDRAEEETLDPEDNTEPEAVEPSEPDPDATVRMEYNMSDLRPPGGFAPLETASPLQEEAAEEEPVTRDTLKEKGYILPESSTGPIPSPPEPPSRPVSRTLLWAAVVCVLAAGGFLGHRYALPWLLKPAQAPTATQEDHPNTNPAPNQPSGVESEQVLLGRQGESTEDRTSEVPEETSVAEDTPSSAESIATSPVGQPREETVATRTKPERPATPPRDATSPTPGQTSAPRARDFHALAQQTVKNLSATSARFTIAFVVACDPETLEPLFSKHGDDALKVLPRRIGDRDCFIGIWGQYSTQEEARRALDSLPSWLKNPSDPPWILNLAKYL